MAKNFKPLFTWRSAVLQSDLPPTARHLALTLSTYMNEAGGSVYPGADRLARDTGLSKVSVMKWRKALTDLGWLVLVRQGGSFHEGGRLANEYEAIIPANFASSWADAPPEFRDQKLGRKPTDQATLETGQGDLPVNPNEPTGQPERAAPGNDVDPTPQRRLPQLSIEPSNQPSSTPPGGEDVASDATPEAASGECDGWFVRLARGIGWDSKGIPDRLRDKMAGTMKEAKALGLSLDRFSDLIWLYRAQGNADVGKLAAALADLDRNIDCRLLPYRAEAAGIVADACAEMGLDPVGRCRTAEEAEHVVARLLADRHDPERIAKALRAAPAWGHGHLGTAMAQADRPLRLVGSATLTPDDARRLPFGTIAGKLQGRHLAAEDREFLHEEIRLRVKASLGESNGAPPFDKRDAALFRGMRWKVDETAIPMRGLCEELHEEADYAPDPAATAGEAAFRALAEGAAQPTTRALTEGNHP